MTAENGYVKLWRKLRNSEIRRNPVQCHIWVQILLEAAHQEASLPEGVVLKPGQAIISQRQFAEQIGVSRQQLRTFLDRQRATHRLTHQVTHLGTIVTICNWGRYQNTKKPANPPINPPINPQNATRIEEESKNDRGVNFSKYKNNNNNSKGRVRAKQTARPPRPKFVPPTVEEVAAYCRQRRNGVDAEQFVAFYESKGWRVGSSPMKNWQAAVRTWESRDGRLRKARERDAQLDRQLKNRELVRQEREQNFRERMAQAEDVPQPKLRRTP